MKSLLPLFFAVLVVSSVSLAATGLNDAMLKQFNQLEAYYALPYGSLQKIAWVESRYNAGATNSSSSAAGMYQWLRGSWLQATRARYGYALPPQQRFNPFIAAEVTAFSLGQTQDRIGSLVNQAGVDPTVGLYMGHFLGEGGARKFFSLMLQNPHAPAAPYFPTQARANSTVFGNNSFAQVVNQFAAKLGKPGVFALSNYNNGVFEDASQYGRVLDANAAAGLGQMYVGPVPATDPERDYQSTYTPQKDLPPSLPSIEGSVSTTRGGTSLNDAYGTSTNQFPGTTNSFAGTGLQFPISGATKTPPVKTTPTMSSEKLSVISVAAPTSTKKGPTSTPLTQEEFDRLQAQQNVILPPEEEAGDVFISDATLFDAAPFSGFVDVSQYTEEELNAPDAVLVIYLDVLEKISRALTETLDFLRGVPAL